MTFITVPQRQDPNRGATLEGTLRRPGRPRGRV